MPFFFVRFDHFCLGVPKGVGCLRPTRENGLTHNCVGDEVNYSIYNPNPDSYANQSKPNPDPKPNQTKSRTSGKLLPLLTPVEPQSPFFGDKLLES